MRTISTAINYTPRVFLRVDLRRQGTKGGAKQKKKKRTRKGEKKAGGEYTRNACTRSQTRANDDNKLTRTAKQEHPDHRLSSQRTILSYEYEEEKKAMVTSIDRLR